jgi:transcription termination/antitermination protein NusG
VSVAVSVSVPSPSSFLPHLEGCDNKHWFAVYTCVNQEKRVAERFQDREIEYFLPTFKSVRRRSDRRVILDQPLFPGYLFARFSSVEKRRVLDVPRVVRLLGTSSVASVIPDREVQALQAGLRENPTASPFHQLRRGDRVRVLRGPFAGKEGTLVLQKHKFRLVLCVQVIQQSFSIEIGQEDVERIG